MSTFPFDRVAGLLTVLDSGHQAFLTTEALNNIAETTRDNLKSLREKGSCENVVKAQ